MSFLRKLFGRRTQAAATPTPPAQTRPPSEASRPQPEASRAQPETSRPQPAAAPEDCAVFPLKAITDLFPPELKASLHKQPSEHVQVQIPRALIEPQLAAGAVRITFAQLRAATPEIFFNAEGAPADAKVLLPLDCVLRQMTPARRNGQRQPSIPVSIPSAFLRSDKGGAPRANGSPARAAAEPWYSQRRPSYELPAEAAQDQRPAQSAVSTAKKPLQSLASATESPRPAPELAAPAQAATPPGCFALPLAAVLAALPAEIRQRLNGSAAGPAAFHIPLGEIESRMRTGKLLFKWGQLRAWCAADLAAQASPDLDIELPLAAVVPLFMAAREIADPRKQVEIDSRIPDIFSKAKTAPPTAEPPAVSAEPPAPVPAPPPEPALPIPAPPKAANGGAAPAQVVKDIPALDGVSGSFIATADGLLIASDLPDANENVLAAFAPTVFAQLTKYADMARLGLPESVDINLAGATIHVRKAGKLFVGVLMPAGHPLPLADITRISQALQPNTP